MGSGDGAPTGGGVLVSGQTGSGNIDNSDFTDTWRVEVSDSGTLKLDLNRTSGDVDLHVNLYGPDGTEIPIEKADSKAIHVEKTKLTPGTYTLMISRENTSTSPVRNSLE